MLVSSVKPTQSLPLVLLYIELESYLYNDMLVRANTYGTLLLMYRSGNDDQHQNRYMKYHTRHTY
jgi:hypothetical protein